MLLTDIKIVYACGEICRSHGQQGSIVQSVLPKLIYRINAIPCLIHVHHCTNNHGQSNVSCCCDQHCSQSKLEKGFVLPFRLYFIFKGNQGRNLGCSCLQQKPAEEYCLLVCSQAHALIKHRSACPGIVMSAVGQALLRNQQSRKCPHRPTTSQNNRKLLN